MISLRREDAQRLGYDRASQWMALLRSKRAMLCRHMKIDSANLRWYAAFHNEGHHPHVHLVVYSAKENDGYLTKPSIEAMRSELAHDIFRQDFANLYEEQNQAREELKSGAEDVLRQKLEELKSGVLVNGRIERMMITLSERLQNTSGKKVYGYLKRDVKNLVDQIVDELAKDERVAAAYNLWNQMREEVCRTYSEQLPERLPLSKQKEFKAVRNMVIRETLRLGRCEPPTTDEVVHGFTPSSTPPAQSGMPHGVHHPQQKVTHHQRTQTHRTVSHADTARCVLQLFHNMGRIFREQSASDAIQACLHIDRKRRRMLREKRMALGHKADDHEEIPQHSQR